METPSSELVMFLQKRIAKSYTLDELRLVCAALDVDYEDIQGHTIAVKSLDLIKYLIRRDKLTELIEFCKHDRPPSTQWDIDAPVIIKQPGQVIDITDTYKSNQISEQVIASVLVNSSDSRDNFRNSPERETVKAFRLFRWWFRQPRKSKILTLASLCLLIFFTLWIVNVNICTYFSVSDFASVIGKLTRVVGCLRSSEPPAESSATTYLGVPESSFSNVQVASTKQGTELNLQHVSGFPKDIVVYLANRGSDSPTYVGTFNLGIGRTVDGDNWQLSTRGIPADSKKAKGMDAFNVRTLAIDPTNTSRVIAGLFEGAYVSNDQGETWRRADAGLPTNKPVKQLDIRAQLAFAIVGDPYSGELYSSKDGAITWSLVQNSSRPMTNVLESVYVMAISPSGDQILVGSNDGLYSSSTSSPWEFQKIFEIPTATVIALVQNSYSVDEYYLALKPIVDINAADQTLIYKWKKGQPAVQIAELNGLADILSPYPLHNNLHNTLLFAINFTPSGYCEVLAISQMNVDRVPVKCPDNIFHMIAVPTTAKVRPAQVRLLFGCQDGFMEVILPK